MFLLHHRKSMCVFSVYGHLMKKVLTSSTNKNVTPGRLPFTLRDDSMLDLVCHRISDRCKDILMGFWWKEACFPKELQTWCLVQLLRAWDLTFLILVFVEAAAAIKCPSWRETSSQPNAKQVFFNGKLNLSIFKFFQVLAMMLMMEEILHHLGLIKPCK